VKRCGGDSVVWGVCVWGLDGWSWIILDSDLVLECFADESFTRGWLVLLRLGAGCFVVFVMSDFFWRLPLFFGFIFVVASSCLSFGLIRCLGCFEGTSPSS